MECRVLLRGQTTDPFEVKTGVRQGCLLSPFLFLLAVDWIMKQVTLEGRTGIQWTLTSHLEDLDFADDLALLSHSHNHMQEKTDRLDKVSKCGYADCLILVVTVRYLINFSTRG